MSAVATIPLMVPSRSPLSQCGRLNVKGGHNDTKNAAHKIDVLREQRSVLRRRRSAHGRCVGVREDSAVLKRLRRACPLAQRSSPLWPIVPPIGQCSVAWRRWGCRVVTHCPPAGRRTPRISPYPSGDRCGRTRYWRETTARPPFSLRDRDPTHAVLATSRLASGQEVSEAEIKGASALEFCPTRPAVTAKREWPCAYAINDAADIAEISASA